MFIWLVGVPVALGQILYWHTIDNAVLKRNDITKAIKYSFFSWAIYLIYDIEKINEYLDKNK